MLGLSPPPATPLAAARCFPSSSSPLKLTTNQKPTLFAKSKPPTRSFINPISKRFPLAISNSDAAAPLKQDASSTPSTPSYSASDETVSVGEEGVPLEGVIQFEKSGSGSKIQKWGRIALLAGGDVMGLVLFAAIGRLGHGLPVFDVDTLRTADPFIAGWFLSAYFLGGYDENGRGMNGWTKAVIAAAKSWALGIPLGVGIRAVSLGHLPPINFISVTMGSTAVLLIGWRALFFRLFGDGRSKDDVYKRGSPFELFESAITEDISSLTIYNRNL
ncbi:hypothetical protein AKJ16_DCAP14165 [Drosera capensis]